eukprot:CAMPEP_0114166300 /NCGR_PEP_ID=MMETSP0043_2-20121206/31757_1 /TAXON_ID=464988 /ORGANISM="Hemiselmis andersenii, Strain CCMP644" /LENGTH=64 /DNA_ID=CAMNT_0001263277 /DNA_START=16 /DNA_END=206 /DNA_ORIENTATION=-
MATAMAAATRITTSSPGSRLGARVYGRGSGSEETSLVRPSRTPVSLRVDRVRGCLARLLSMQKA